MTQLGTKKSRNGCSRCKRRRVKCDEQLPCSNCMRRNENCSLLNRSPSSSTQGHSTPEISTQDWLQDLELMHHYSLESQVFGTEHRPEIQDVWRKVVPTYATKHTFLMHGILAMSALHIAKKRPEEATKYQQICDRHQTIALEAVHEIIPKIDKGNAEAVFAFSASLSAVSLARATLIAQQRPKPHFINMDEIAETFVLTKGVRHIVQQARDWVHAGPLRAFVHGYSTPEGADVPAEVHDRFKALDSMLKAYCENTELLGVCREALECLLDVYKCVFWYSAESDIESGIVVRWISMLNTMFVSLIRSRHQPSLVVLAHFVVLFTTMRSAWFIAGWPQYTFLGIEMAVEPAFRHWLDWPRKLLEDEMAILTNPTPGLPISYKTTHG